ncbi:hypothetical protein NE237_010534 [Protea cynaroides]|uniref:Uncharacterized protein n=1 Tax=Protea cynaroides TaxID=273540 RepID=A0A9Q0R1N6_9MAGN|nr:hypothetical protein NE237_010534 [Protea cynaroides]
MLKDGFTLLHLRRVKPQISKSRFFFFFFRSTLGIHILCFCNSISVIEEFQRIEVELTPLRLKPNWFNPRHKIPPSSRPSPSTDGILTIRPSPNSKISRLILRNVVPWSSMLSSSSRTKWICRSPSADLVMKAYVGPAP